MTAGRHQPGNIFFAHELFHQSGCQRTEQQIWHCLNENPHEYRGKGIRLIHQTLGRPNSNAPIGLQGIQDADDA